MVAVAWLLLHSLSSVGFANMARRMWIVLSYALFSSCVNAWSYGMISWSTVRANENDGDGGGGTLHK